MSKLKFNADWIAIYKERYCNAEETLKVLKHNISIFWSWGVSRKVNMQDHGLLLTVEGRHHKGHVLITLAWDDTYTVRYFNRNYNEVKEKQTGIYFDMLVETIDNTIEKVDAYAF